MEQSTSQPGLTLEALRSAVSARVGQPCPSVLGGAERVAWQNYSGSLRSFGTRLDNLTEPALPGGPGAALGGMPGASALTSVLGGSLPPSLGAPGGFGAGGIPGAESMNMQFLALQNAVAVESRMFHSISNASRAGHETARSVIGNMR